MTTTKVLRVSANTDYRINIYVDSEQVGFNQSLSEALELLLWIGKPKPVAITMINATMPVGMKLVCTYPQTEISVDTNNACVNCWHSKKEHPVG